MRQSVLCRNHDNALDSRTAIRPGYGLQRSGECRLLSSVGRRKDGTYPTVPEIHREQHDYGDRLGQRTRMR